MMKVSLKHKIGDRVKLKMYPEIEWIIVGKNHETYVLSPFEWDRELRVGTITDKELLD